MTDKFAFLRSLAGREDLTHAEFRVLVLLMNYTDRHLMNAYPGTVRLAQDMAINDVRQVRRLLKSLEAKGYLEVVWAGGSRRGSRRSATNYMVTLPDHPFDRPTEGSEHPQSDESTEGSEHPQSGGTEGAEYPPTEGDEHPRPRVVSTLPTGFHQGKTKAMEVSLGGGSGGRVLNDDEDPAVADYLAHCVETGMTPNRPSMDAWLRNQASGVVGKR